MERFTTHAKTTARVLIAMVFILNALGVIDQTIPAKELIAEGAPPSLVPFFMFAGRGVEFVAGIFLALGILPQISALALLAFLVPATFVSHSFWLSAGTPAFMGQLINFSKNIAIWGGLLFVGFSSGQPLLIHITENQRTSRGQQSLRTWSRSK